jgi:hypothetical protein
MANELYNNTYEKDITANILLKTGLDYSEIAMLLASQVSNCIKLVLRGQQIWIEQVTALAIDLSNKECFEASISYTYCGRTLVYKAKLNITYAPNCVAPILHTITYASGSFTITGQIANSYLEYSTNNGTTWTRLPTPYPDTTSITTSLLPTNIDLKVRMVAVCDETKISNVLDYDAPATIGILNINNNNPNGNNSVIISIIIDGTPITLDSGFSFPIGTQQSASATYTLPTGSASNILVSTDTDIAAPLRLNTSIGVSLCQMSSGLVTFESINLSSLPIITIDLDAEGLSC